MSKSIIRAAGGVLWRGRADVPAEIEVALVHRPKYDDWTLPKGKAHQGESLLAAAVREVGEETGARVAVTVGLAGEQYDCAGGHKQVSYWAMRYCEGDFTPSAEVDQVRWVPLAQAREQLSYQRSPGTLDSFSQLGMVDSTALLIRHAKAGKRTKWDGQDSERPLVLAGRVQAERLARFGEFFAPERVIAADRVRCIQTVTPLAERLGLKVEVGQEFTDEYFLRDQAGALAALRDATASAGSVAICSQGSAIPGLLELVSQTSHPLRFATSKGAAWSLGFSDQRLVALEAFPDAAD